MFEDIFNQKWASLKKIKDKEYVVLYTVFVKKGAFHVYVNASADEGLEDGKEYALGVVYEQDKKREETSGL